MSLAITSAWGTKTCRDSGGGRPRARAADHRTLPRRLPAMSFLKGLFGKKQRDGEQSGDSAASRGGGKGLPPEERAALEEYLTAAEPLLERLKDEYSQWLEKTGVPSGTDVTAINDPKGQH